MTSGAPPSIVRKHLPYIAVALIATVFAFALMEGALQAMRLGQPVRYAVWPPGIERVIFPTAKDTPGIEEAPHRFVITPLGYRGRAIGDARLRIAAFGGSTTESLYVPEELSWPSVLERTLAKNLGTSVWVGNFGKSGRNTRQHVLDAKYVLPQFSIQLALFLVGANDLRLVIDSAGAHRPMTLAEIEQDTYLRQSLALHGSHWQLPRAAAAAFGYFTERQIPHLTTEYYRHYRAVRAKRAGFTTQMPELGPMLDEYGRNLAAIADAVRAHGVVPVFITQPSLWSANVPPEVDALFWGGAVGWPPKESGALYYAPATLDKMMTAYNERLRLVANQKNVPLIDAAVHLPKDPAKFYDEFHYNNAGSRALAALIARDLAGIMPVR
jgi:lysophospholipase L1-like esterase